MPSRKQFNHLMDWALENSGWPLLRCKICGRTVGRYPPGETRINRDRCLTCIIEGRKVEGAGNAPGQ
jgi:hypothetical protein